MNFTGIHIDSKIKIKHKTEKIMFTLIKQLNFLELSKLFDRIDKKKYQSLRDPKLERYHQVKDMINNFELLNFIKVCSIEI